MLLQDISRYKVPDRFLLFCCGTHLIENSIKYSEQEPVEVEISLREQEDRLLLTVSDNGVGVPEEKLPHIFEEFYRADESRNKKEGNGLGLYIVKYLVEAMKGNVRAENRNGLVISMDFPLKGRLQICLLDHADIFIILNDQNFLPVFHAVPSFLCLLMENP